MASNLSHKGKPSLRAFIYCRISSDPQGKQAGVERQEDDCRKLVASQGWTVAEVFVDNDVSASDFSTKSRPEWDRMIKALKENRAECLVAYDDSRLTRKSDEFMDLMKICRERGITVRTCQAEINFDNADSRNMARIISSLRTYESDKMSERMRRAHRGNAEKGARRSPVRTYGYRIDKITADPIESDFVRQMVERAINGESATQIAKWLNESGQRTVAGTDFQSAGVKKIITNPMIAGIQKHRGELMPDVEVGWDALVSRDDYFRATAKLAERSTGRRGNPGTLLMGFVFCPNCDRKMYRTGNRTGHDRDGVFRCHKRTDGGCGLSINAPKLESLVRGAVLTQLGERKTIRRSTTPTSQRKRKDDPNELRKQIDRVAKQYADGSLEESEWRIISDGLRKRLSDAERPEFVNLGADAHAIRTLERAGKSLKDEWDTLDLHIRQRLIGLVVDRIEILKGEKGRHFNLDRVKILWKV